MFASLLLACWAICRVGVALVLIGSLKKNEPRCHTPAPQAQFWLDKHLSQMGVAMLGRQVSIKKGVR